MIHPLRFRVRASLLVSAFLWFAFMPGVAFAQATFTFTTNTTIGVSSTVYEGTNIVVRGCTVTIDGSHSFHSLTLQDAGVVTHSAAQTSGMQLTIAQDVTVPSGCRIDATGKGYPAYSGPGAGTSSAGGSYGGHGNIGYSGTAGPVYGSLTQPTDLGSGGANGSGGGSVRLVVGGTLQMEGSLSADGSSTGSGGSVYITAGTLAGNGTITANGGNYVGGWWWEILGGGGGGRIALYLTTTTFPAANVSASGGIGYPGGAGTVYTRLAGQPLAHLTIVNAYATTDTTDLNGVPTQYETLTVVNAAPVFADPVTANQMTLSGSVATLPALTVNTPLTVTDSTLKLTVGNLNVSILSLSSSSLLLPFASLLNLNSLTLAGNSRIAPTAYPTSTTPSQPNFVVQVAGNCLMDASSRITVSGYGYPAYSGPGAGTSSAGGSYGGHGNIGYSGTAGPVYGSLTQPTDLGSGGANGSGGGSVRLVVGGTLQMEGSLSADGSSTGSGGSVYITAGTLAGNGTITANGGNYVGGWWWEILGGGGGGRIALYLTIITFPAANVSASGGIGYPGEAGTIYYGVYNPAAPTVTILSGPAPHETVPTRDVVFTFTGSSNITATPNLRYQYSVEGGPWLPLASDTSVTLLGLNDGPHIFGVESIDGLGVVSVPAYREFTVDATLPLITAISATPNFTDAAITWTTNKPTSSQVHYRKQGDAAWIPTPRETVLITAHTVTLSNLMTNTTYEYQAFSRDSLDRPVSSAVLTFRTKRDTLPPTTTITGGPTEGSTLDRKTATFSFTGTDNITPSDKLKFQYRLDSAKWLTLNVPTVTLNGLPEGPHRFSVAAIDQAGNVDPNPPSRNFTVDTLLPTISHLAASPVGITDAVITWETNKPTSAQVNYRRQGETNWQTGPLFADLITTHRVTLTSLSPDTAYEFQALSVDSLMRSVTSDALPFQTLPDTVPPITTVTLGPANGGYVQPGPVIFSWTGQDNATPVAQLQYQISVDGEAWTPLDTLTTRTLNGLALGEHTFSVAAIDQAGNADANPPVVHFTIDGNAPAITAYSISNLAFNAAQLNWRTDEPTIATVQVALGSDDYSLTFAYPVYSLNHALVIGPLGSNTAYRVRIVASDRAGNQLVSPELPFTTLPLRDLGLASADLSFSNPAPAAGQSITMTASVHNFGDVGMSGTLVFYDYTPQTGSREIGRRTLSIPAYAAPVALTSPPFVVLEGAHTPYVQIIHPQPGDDIGRNDGAIGTLQVNAPARRLTPALANPQTWPGNDSLFTVIVTNTGSAPQTLSNASITGLAWASLYSTLPEAPVLPGQQAQITFRLTPPQDEPGGPTNNPRHLPATLNVNGFAQPFAIEIFNGPVCLLDVTVRSATTGLPISGALVALDNSNQTWFTNAAGKPLDPVTGLPTGIPVAPGSRNVYAVADGYIAGAINTDCSVPVVFSLTPGRALEISRVTVTPLTQQQIIERGIQIHDPINNYIVDFVIYMKIGPLRISGQEIPRDHNNGWTVCGDGIVGGGFGGGGGGFGFGSEGTPVQIQGHREPGIPGGPPPPTVWIVIPGDIRLLKQFWDASVLIVNNTDSIDIQNVEATLEIPDGLALPDLFHAPQPATQSLGIIAPHGQKQALWVVRGDLAGKYKLTGKATGQLGGTGISLNTTLESGEFEVITPKINVTFETPSEVRAGQEFTVTITIQNPNSIDLNGVEVNIKAEKLVNCIIPTGRPSSLFIGVIPVGQSRSVTFTFTSLVTGSVEQVQTYVSPLPVEPEIRVVERTVLRPRAVNDAADTPVGTPVTIPVLANDTDPQGYPLSVSAVTQGAHGSVVINPDNTLTYTPTAGFVGKDAFNYSVADGHGNTGQALVSVAVGKVRVSGRVVLQGYTDIAGQELTFVFRPLDGSSVITQTAALAADGSVNIARIPARRYSLGIKGRKWLRRVTVADGSNGNDVLDINVLLPAGDANDDNAVDALDLAILITAFNTFPGDAFYDPTADFNGDHAIDALDLAILITNFNTVGDP